MITQYLFSKFGEKTFVLLYKAFRKTKIGLHCIFSIICNQKFVVNILVDVVTVKNWCLCYAKRKL